MNLYLYIPPSSSHPPSCFKGLLAGEHKCQNKSEDFKKILLKFINRLLNRGHSLDNLKPLLMPAAAAIDSHTTTPTKTETETKNSSIYPLDISCTWNPEI
jgi:hypothetical protein